MFNRRKKMTVSYSIKVPEGMSADEFAEKVGRAVERSGASATRVVEDEPGEDCVEIASFGGVSGKATTEEERRVLLDALRDETRGRFEKRGGAA